MSTRSDAPTFGIEEEFLLVDPETGHPLPHNREVADAARDDGVKLQLELTRCQVETSSSVLSTSAEALDEIRGLRAKVAAAADRVGACLLAVGVPPTIPDGFPITDSPRYRRIGAQFGMIAHEQGVCGCHVHVQVPDRETAVQVSNHLRQWLPTLLATTANSSVYRDADSGHASWRTVVWSRWPAAGPPPYFESAQHYDDLVARLNESGAILDDGMVYWDVRASSNFPTIEVRVSDVAATAAETVTYATLVRALVMTALAAIERGEDAPRIEAEMLRAAQWKAAHDGLAGSGVDLLAGRAVSALNRQDRMVEWARSALEELGEYDAVRASLRRTARRGNGAIRQRNALREDGISGVLREVITATRR